MKLLRYGTAGAEKPGLLDADGNIRDLSRVVPDIEGAVLSPAGLSKLRSLDPDSLPLVGGSPRIGACVGKVGKFVAIGLNYYDHAEESGLPVPREPIVFLKATSAISGPNDPVELPKNANKVDWEIELAFVIGTVAKKVSEAEAMNHVAGYCICNDISERAWQHDHEGQWTKGKSHDTFGPLGPWLVTADEVDDPDNVEMTLDVNGIRRQSGTTREMIFSIPYLVHYLSQFMTLHPGDVVTTGTPPGVGMGMTPQIFLSANDVMELSIEKLGHQRQRVVAA